MAGEGSSHQINALLREDLIGMKSKSSFQAIDNHRIAFPEAHWLERQVDLRGYAFDPANGHLDLGVSTAVAGLAFRRCVWRKISLQSGQHTIQTSR